MICFNLRRSAGTDVLVHMQKMFLFPVMDGKEDTIGAFHDIHLDAVSSSHEGGFIGKSRIFG